MLVTRRGLWDIWRPRQFVYTGVEVYNKRKLQEDSILLFVELKLNLN